VWAIVGRCEFSVQNRPHTLHAGHTAMSGLIHVGSRCLEVTLEAWVRRYAADLQGAGARPLRGVMGNEKRFGNGRVSPLHMGRTLQHEARPPQTP
jgi:hypothetical protein